MFYVYILYSEKFDRFYIGQTNNLTVRINQHNSGEVKSTKHYIPWKIVYKESFETRKEAMQRERFLKKQRNKNFYKKLCSIIES